MKRTFHEGNWAGKTRPWKTVLVVLVSLGVIVGCSARRDLMAPTPETRESAVTSPAREDVIVLLPDPDGKVGSLQVTTRGGSQTLDKPGHGTQVKVESQPPTPPRTYDEKEIQTVFRSALSSQPDLAGRFTSFTLYFERNTIRLTRESRKLLPEVARTISNRKSQEVYVTGHTDRLGADDYNIGLSSKRAGYIRDLLVSTGIASSTLIVSFRGETMPLVYTEDEVAEARNRRVEVIIR